MGHSYSVNKFRLIANLCLPLLLSLPAVAQQVQLVDVIPALYSNETNTDSEPNVAVNPASPLNVVVTAFTPCPPLISTTNAPRTTRWTAGKPGS